VLSRDTTVDERQFLEAGGAAETGSDRRGGSAHLDRVRVGYVRRDEL